MAATVTLTTPTGKKAQATYRALVDRTRAVIGENGSFSAEQVAERASMSPATFYTYFPSKDEALAAALNEVLDELVERTLAECRVEQLLDHGLRVVLERVVDGCLEIFTADAMVLRLAIARLPDSKVIRHVYREHQKDAFERLKRFIDLGAAAGRLSVEDRDGATTAFLVMLQGLNNPVVLNRDAHDPAVAHLVDALIHLLDPLHASA